MSWQEALRPSIAAEPLTTDPLPINLSRSLMLVTAPDPQIGYDLTVKISKLALAENTRLKPATERLGHLRALGFDRWAAPASMAVPDATLPGGGA